MSDPHFRDAAAPLDRARLYAGELLVFRNQPAVHALIRVAEEHLGNAFAGGDARHAQNHLDPGEFRRRAGKARKAFMHSEAAQAGIRQLLTALGQSIDDTYCDRAILRLQPSGQTHSSQRLRDLPWHRDTWGSGIACQINWWFPIYPLEPGATMLILPTQFQTPVANNSAQWNLEEFRAAPNNYPLLPSTTAEPSGTAVPVLINPGDLLCFSAAHLHASTRNGTGLTRLSADLRTVHRGDWIAGLGAPDVDNGVGAAQPGWFTRASDGVALSR